MILHSIKKKGAGLSAGAFPDSCVESFPTPILSL